MYEFINSMPQDETLDGLRLGLYSLLLAKHLLPDGEQIEKGRSAATDPGFPRRGANTNADRQPIVWLKFR